MNSKETFLFTILACLFVLFVASGLNQAKESEFFDVEEETKYIQSDKLFLELDGFETGKIEDWSGLENSGFKNILYKEYKLKDNSELKLKEKWLEIMIFEAYSNEVALEYSNNWRYTNSLDKPNTEHVGLYNYTQYDLNLADYSWGERYYFYTDVVSIWSVKDNVVVNLIYHSNFNEDVEDIALNYINALLSNG